MNRHLLIPLSVLTLFSCWDGLQTGGTLIPPQTPIPFPKAANPAVGDAASLQFSDTISLRGEHSGKVISADLDKDGKIDLVFPDVEHGTIHIWFNQGGGQFEPPSSLAVPASSGMAQVEVVDINQDGLLDIILGTFTNKTLQVLVNQNNRTFLANPVLNLPNQPNSFSAGDFNGDSKIDLAIYTVTIGVPSGNLLFYPGNGDSTFGTSSSIVIDASIGTIVGKLKSSDINGDGKLDLLAIGQRSMMTSIAPCILSWEGKGDGTFQPMKGYNTGGSIYPSWVDINQDGLIDAIADVVFLGKSDGSFAQNTDWRIPQVVHLGWGDINQDGALDLVAITWNPNKTGGLLDVKPSFVFTLYRGDKKGNFTQIQQQPAPGYWGTPDDSDTLMVADVNQDSWPDVIYSAAKNGTVSLYFGDQQGKVQSPKEFSPGLSTPTQVLSGKDHSVVLDTSQQTVFSVPIGTKGLFFEGARWVKAEISGFQPSAMTMADVDKDGHEEVIVISKINQQMRILQNIRGRDDQERLLSELPTRWNAGSSPSAVVVADWNQDGIQDILITENTTSTIRVYEGKGTLTFAAPYEFSVGFAPTQFLVSDLNQDQIPDVAFLSSTDENLRIVWGVKTGTSNPITTISVKGAPKGLVLGDINQDGYPDLITTSSQGVWLVLNQGKGRFITETPRWGISEPHTPQLADFNQDGYLDLAITDTKNNSVVLLHGVGAGKFIKTQTIPVGLGPTALAIASFDHDASLPFERDTLPDLLVVNSISRTMSSIRNNGSQIVK